MSLQMLFKLITCWCAPNTVRQIVPRGRACDSECTLAELQTGPRDVRWRATSDARWKPHYHSDVIRVLGAARRTTYSQLVTGQACYLTQHQVLFPVATTTPHLTFDLQRCCHHWCTHLSPAVSTIALVYWQVHRRRQKLQRLLNAAARVVSNSGKYDWGLTQFQCHTLQWLNIVDKFRLCIQVYKCQHSMAPGYLAELRRPVTNIDSHRHLWSAGRGRLDIPQIRLSTYRGWAFCYAGPSAWHALPDILNDTLYLSSFRCQLKHFSSSHYYQTECI